MAASQFTISPVARGQFDEWLRLREAVYSELPRDFHLREMEIYFQDNSKACLLACDERGQACGMIELALRNIVDGCLTSPVGFVEGIVVDHDRRGQGLGRWLLEHGEQWFRARGCREIATDAELDHEASQRFHLHMGFQETYRIVEYRKDL